MTNPDVDRERRWSKDDDDDVDGPAETRRDRILTVAAEEFEINGFAGARIDEIARLAKVNKQLIYYYFNSKRVLHSNVMEHVTVRALDEPNDDSDKSYVKSVKRMCAASFSRTRNRLYRYWLWEAVEGSSRGEIARADERREHYARMVAHVAQAQADGEIDSDFDPRFLHLGVVAIVSFPHIAPQIASLITGMEPDDPEFIKAQEEFVDQVTRALGPPQG